MQHIRGFHALRAFSVLLVIVSHIGIIESATSPFAVRFFSVFNASYGVKTFFVLSGFLITTLLIREGERNGKINVPYFMMRRALRILPLYFLVVAIAASLILAGIAEPSWTAMLFGTLYIYNFIPKGENVNYLSHLWSLAVEEQFYLVWPFLFAAWLNRKSALMAVCVAFISVCYLFLQRDLGWLSNEFYTQRWTVPAIYPISIGSLLALTVSQWSVVLRSYPALCVSAALVALPLLTAVTPGVEIASTFGIAGAIAWIFLRQENRVVRALDWAPIYYIGTISYGLYMWQGLLTGNGPYRVTPGWPPDPLSGAILTIPAAVASYHLFERPISNLGRRFSPR